MEEHYKCLAGMLIVIGVVVILVRLYTAWDIWVVIGAIAIIKGLICLIKPTCICEAKPAAKKKK